MARGLEAAHGPFASARWLVRVLRTVVQTLVLAMLHARQHLLLRCLVAAKLVRDDHAWHIATALEQFPEELPRCSFVATALHQDIQHVPILIDRSPQVLRLSIDLQEHFIQKLLVAWPSTAAELVGVGLSELQTPLAHRFVGHDDPAFGQQLFYITVAQ